jgi:hypothetical protein
MDHLTLFESVCGLHSPKIMWCIIIFSLKHALKKLGALSSMLIQNHLAVQGWLIPHCHHKKRLHSTRGSREKKTFSGAASDFTKVDDSDSQS